MTGSASHPDPGRPLGRTGLTVSPLAYGAFKIGRNQGIKYPQGYDLPDEAEVARLVDGLLELGIDFFDTAPAYGLSEERLGRVLAGRRDDVVLSTKAGETFEHGKSRYDFSADAVTASVERSLQRLRTDAVDLLLIHSDGRDLEIMERGDAVTAVQDAKRRGLARAVGFSGKTPEGAEAALAWADVLMVPYHADDRSHEDVIARAGAAGVGVVVKKGLASGHLEPAEAIRFLLANEHVASVVVGSLSLENMRRNVVAAEGVAKRA